MRGREAKAAAPVAGYRMSGADPMDKLEVAADTYGRKFGTQPGVHQFMGKQAELAALIREAVARGKPLTSVETYLRLGMTPPPEDAVL